MSSALVKKERAVASSLMSVPEHASYFLPALDIGIWRACLRDLDAGNILSGRCGLKDAFVHVSKRWHVPLGMPARKEEPAKSSLPDECPPTEEPYGCRAVQVPTSCQYWNNPAGWSEGNSRLKHAASLKGNSSGFAWQAWSAGIPVVRVSGFTHPTNKFATPFRIMNWCIRDTRWNDPKERFDHHDFLWCPRYANTPHQFDDTCLITGWVVTTAFSKHLHFKG